MSETALSGMIYIGDRTTESTKCPDIDTSMFIRRSNDIDISGEKIVNLGDPVQERDAMNHKKFISEIAEFETRMIRDITTKIDTRITAVTPSIETRLRETIVTQVSDKYNFNNQKLTNLLAGTKDTDAVNFQQLKTQVL